MQELERKAPAIEQRMKDHVAAVGSLKMAHQDVANLEEERQQLRTKVAGFPIFCVF